MVDRFSPTAFGSLALMAIAAIALTGCSVSVGASDNARRVETESIPAGGIVALSLVTENGAVQISGGDVETIQIETTFDEPDRGDGTSAVSVVGDLLEVAGDCDRSWYEQCSVSYRIVVPPTIAITLETDNGRVELRDLEGLIDVYTDNGAIEGAGLLATDVRARTDNGRVELGFTEVPDAVEARTDNGRVDIRVPTSGSAYAVDAESDNGDVDVTVATDPTAERTIEAYSDNGAVTIREM